MIKYSNLCGGPRFRRPDREGGAPLECAPPPTRRYASRGVVASLVGTPPPRPQRMATVRAVSRHAPARPRRSFPPQMPRHAGTMQTTDMGEGTALGSWAGDPAVHLSEARRCLPHQSYHPPPPPPLLHHCQRGSSLTGNPARRPGHYRPRFSPPRWTRPCAELAAPPL